ncbi:SDR family NAD(P)-dependent oxidoreductase [Promicromonospora citrea]|uniref:Probable oxidoreductase n=1 Tax=Promicromonospora citrea TaxID=43677 RepID=A0A8H9GPW6_9MICO|nr:SDR family NAD(P)-dependent oxidoreductase [Promicromonospora citrea]GGM44415.1 oxidoreductase [Promicromonospora citrea]
MANMAPDDIRRVITPFTRDSTAAEVLEGIDLHGRRALVTGGASGLGAETVRALASAGADVTIATRRPRAADTLLGELATAGVPGHVRVAPLDLADLSSVRRFVASWDGPLDALVANAGILALPERILTPYGWELQQATNYLGHFALATGLHPALRDAGDARVVVVSSGAHLTAPVDLDDPGYAHQAYDPWVAYGRSKSAGILFTVGARRWATDGITATSANPGYILTGLQRHVDDDTLRALGVMDDDGTLTPLPYYKTPAQGAATSVLLAASPLVTGVTGRYFEDNQEATTVRDDDLRAGDVSGGVAEHALDPDTADRLWERATLVLGDA